MVNIHNLVTIFRRELAAYFNSAIAYIFIIVFVLLNGGLFMTQFFLIGRTDMRPFFGFLPLVLAVFLPAVTMRLWAEERKGNTLELLLTFPMRPQELVLGKFFASLIFYLAALVGTLTIPLMLQFLGKPDVGAMASAYAGSFLLGGFFLAIGIFISGLARDQIVAFILAMITCFGFYLIGTDLFASSVDGWLPGLGSFLRNYIGSPRHFDSFAKGVVDTQDVLYFLIGMVVFLVLNGFWLEGRMRPKAKTIFSSALLISVGIFIFANVLLSGLSLGRFDLTEGKIYTIAPATRTILNRLKAPVTAKFYVSPAEKMPTGMKTLEQEVVDKLDELRIASKGKFQYKIFHMEAAKVVGGAGENENSLEQQMSEKGIRPFQVQSIQADEVGLSLVYSAISLAYKEKAEEIIPRIFPDNLHELEYLLISRVYRMMLAEIPKIALVAPYQEKTVEPELQALLSQLGGQVPEGYREDPYEVLPMALKYAGYEVSRIKLTEKESIPEGVKTLVVVEPKELSDRQKYELNHFLVSGGSLMLAVQNYTYQYTAATDQLQIEPEEKKPGVNSLLGAWGFGVDENILVGQQHDVVNLSGAARLGPYELAIPVKVPIQILIPQSGMNPQISITSRLSPLFYLWGTAVSLNPEKIKEQNLSVDTLLTSSLESWTVPFKNGSLTPEDLKPADKTKRGPFPLALMAQGQFKDAYSGQAIPEWPKSEPANTAAVSPPKSEAVVSKETKLAPGKMILIGASSFFQKQLIRSGGHLNFFLNSVDALTLGDELVSVRSKQPIDRSIGHISTTTKVAWRFFVTLLIPLLIAVIGASRVFWRRQAKQNYVRLLSSVE